MFKKKFSKKATGIIVGAFALTCAAIGGITASACSDCGNNWSDKEETFVLNAGANTDNSTNCREKRDTSKIYVKCTDTYYGFYIKPHGTLMSGDPRACYATSEDCSYGESAKGKGASFKKGTVKYLQNTVFEKGYPNAYLSAYPVEGWSNYEATILWSPDNYDHK